MGMEIMREGSQTSEVKGEGDGLKIALKKAVLVSREPTGRSIEVVREEGFGGFMEMLTSMKPIHNLYTIGEEVSHEMPDPGCAIGSDTGIGRSRNMLADCDHPQ